MDFRLFVDVEGASLVPDGPVMRERPVLLLLHGGPGLDHSVFKPLFSSLTDVCQIVYVDQRGHGRSDRGTPDQWTLDVWADDIVRLCDVIGVERPIVFGNSFGGMVALRYLATHPGHAGKAILSSTAARLDVNEIAESFRDLGGDNAAAAARAFWTDPADADSIAVYREICVPLYTQGPGSFLDNSRAITSPDVTAHFINGEQQTMNLLPGLAAVTCDVLLLAGGRDPVCPPRGMEAIRDALVHAVVRHEYFPDAGHGVFRDEPEPAVALLRAFVA